MTIEQVLPIVLFLLTCLNGWLLVILKNIRDEKKDMEALIERNRVYQDDVNTKLNASINLVKNNCMTEDRTRNIIADNVMPMSRQLDKMFDKIDDLQLLVMQAGLARKTKKEE